MAAKKSVAIKKKDGIALRTIHGAIFLIDVTDNFFNNRCALYEINKTGRFIWEQIDGARTVEQLARLLQEAIIDEVDDQILYDDVSEFIDSLIEKGFLEVR